MRTTELPPVLVTDGDQRVTLAMTRALGRAGYPVHVTSTDGHSLSGSSRYSCSDTAVPSALTEPGEYAHEVGEACRKAGARVLCPMTEAALLAVLAAPPDTKPIIPFPDLAHFAAISDKESVLRVAAECEIAVPEQVVLRDRSEARRLHPASLQYPIVIKPARSVSSAGQKRVKLGVIHAATPVQLAAAIEALPDAGFPLLLQQRIVGPGIGIFLLRWNGELVARFSHRRIREKPPSGGVSVYRESIPADPELVRKSLRLLERFGWSGVAMIEFKVDEISGRAYLMEINGRFWGSLQLAVDAGVNFPVLLLELATGKHPQPVVGYRSGVRSRWWWGDVDHLVTRLRRSDAVLGLPPGSPSRAQMLVDFLTLWRPGDRNEIFRWSDPRPFVRETIQWLKGH